jgi:hypothetical protein
MLSTFNLLSYKINIYKNLLFILKDIINNNNNVI